MNITPEFFDYVMSHEKELALEILYVKEERNSNSNSGGHHNGISRPTEMQAIRNLEPVKRVAVNNFFTVENPEQVLRIIRITKAHFNDKKYGQVYKSRYLDHQEWNYTCKALNISKSTYYNYVTVILTYALKQWSVLNEKT